MQLIQVAVTPLSSLGHKLAGLRAYKWILAPVAAFVTTRLAVFAAALIGGVMLPADPGHWEPSAGNALLDMLARWDSQWYQWIVQEGYWLRPGQRSNVAFFPLYPLAIDFVAPFVGDNTILAGVVVSNLAFLVALVFLYLLARLESGNQQAARRTVFYLAVFPTSFFFSMMYSESMFLLFVVAAAYFARRRLWVWAALMGVLASTSRIVGVLTWGLVMAEWLEVQGWQLESIHRRQTWVNLWQGLKRDWFHVLIIAVIPLGLLSYVLFLKTTFNDPLAFSTVQSAWGRQNIGPVAVIARDVQAFLREGLSTSNISRGLNLATMFGVLGLSIPIWRRFGASYAIYTLLALLIPATSATQSILRYTLACFPVFLILGIWGKNALFDRTYTIISAVLLGVLTVIFVNWIFVA